MFKRSIFVFFYVSLSMSSMYGAGVNYAALLQAFMNGYSSSSPMAKIEKSDADFYSISKQVGRGFAEGVSEKIQNSSNVSSSKLFENSFKGLFSGADKALGSKEFQGMNKGLSKATESFLKGMLSSADNALASKEFNKFNDGMGKSIATLMVGASKGVQEGSKESISIFGQIMKDGATEIGTDLHESTNILAKEMQEAFKNGGELDKGLSEGVSLYTRNINRGIQSLVHNNVLKGGAIIVGLSATYFVAKYGIPVAFKVLESALMRPKLIIASSKKGLFQSLFGSKDIENPMIFTPHIQERLDEIVQITSTINKKIKGGCTNVKYRNLMLYGPPGTGKTLFAMELAKRSGMEYACMSGSSFSKFKDGEGIEALDDLFAWANKSKGLMIFIDEAETFLASRDKMDPQSKAYQLINNFLNYTGTKSNKFMLVFATNHKDALDEAMYRRIDDLVEVTLPGKAERIRLLDLYINRILLDKQNNSDFIKSVKNVLTKDVIEEIALKTKGLSGSDIETIMNAIKTDADIHDPAIITKKLVDMIVQRALDKQQAFTGGKPLGSVED